MPCNAIATVAVTVRPEVLDALLGSETAHEAIKQYIIRRYGAVTVQRATGCAVFATADFTLELYRGGRIQVRARDRRLADRVNADFAAFLPKLQATAFQEAVKAKLAKRYAITGEQRANGALVLTMEV